MKKLVFHQEIVYILATIILSFAVAIIAASDLGLSMVVAPAYVLSLYFDFLTFGQAEYVVQGVLFIAFCILMRKIRLSYFFAFLSCFIYGLALDLWRLIPILNPDITAPGSMALGLRILFFASGIILTSLSVAMYFKAYFPPQVNDYFVKGISAKYNIKQSLFKTCYDMANLILAIVLSLCFFGEIRGVGWGTVFITLINGFLIGMFSKLLDRIFDFRPLIPKAQAYFEK